MSSRFVTLVFVTSFAIGCGSSSSGAASDAAIASESGSSFDATSAQGDGASLADDANPSGSDAAATDSGSSADVATGTTITLRVHYPAGTHTVSIRGQNTAALAWDHGLSATVSTDDTWVLTIPATAPIEWKPLLDDSTWSRGPNYKANPGSTVDVYPHFTVTNGTFDNTFTWTSTILGNDRTVRVYLPPTYLENSRAVMPVVYMHDGQNLYDPAIAFGGNTWKVPETIDGAAESGAFREAVVVGMDNTSNRMGEYTPTTDPTTPGGGQGNDYLRAIISELKPQIDAKFRVLKGRQDTVMIGSSLGGLISSWAGTTHADVFGLIGALSPSTWWGSRVLISQVGSTSGALARPIRVYVDSGDSGPSNDDMTNTADLAATYRKIGYVDGSTLDYLVQAGASHNEVYWAQRLPGALTFLLGPGR